MMAIKINTSNKLSDTCELDIVNWLIENEIEFSRSCYNCGFNEIKYILNDHDNCLMFLLKFGGEVCD